MISNACYAAWYDKSGKRSMSFVIKGRITDGNNLESIQLRAGTNPRSSSRDAIGVRIRGCDIAFYQFNRSGANHFKTTVNTSDIIGEILRHRIQREKCHYHCNYYSAQWLADKTRIHIHSVFVCVFIVIC